MDAGQAPVASLDVAIAHADRLLLSDPALAEQQAREILKVVADFPPAQIVLAKARAAGGRTDEALAMLADLARNHPRWPTPPFEAALLLARMGRGDDAIRSLKATLAIDPRQPAAWLALSDHLSATGDLAGAEAAFSQHLLQATADPELMAAGAALAENRIPDAEQRLRARLQRQPTDVVAIRMLAEVAARIGRLPDAERLLQRCLELAPNFHAARQNLAMVLHRANKPREALAQVDAMLRADPRNPNARNLKAVVLCRVGDYGPAIELYDEILKEYPSQGRIWLSLGHALKTAGQRDRAIAAYRRSIELDPGFGEAWWSLANLKTFRFSTEDVDAMRRQLLRTDLDPEQHAQFEFALGKALEDAGDHAASFRHYESGNARRRARLPYRAADATSRVRRSTELFTAEFLAQREGWGCDAPDPIFIVGLPRSGSTLIEQILSSHPAVEGTMELPEVISLTHELRREAADGQGKAYHDVLSGLDAARFRALGEQYLENTRVHRKRGAPFFIDKMPNNFLHVGLIHLMLPRARIVDARRHPLACCFSGYKQYFARGQNFSYGLDDIGRYYRDYVALMAHFDQVLPGRVHRVVYEDMVQDTEAQVRRLLDYCGLPFDAQCLRFFENDRPVRTASSEQVRQPIYRDGVDHWRHYEPWLGPLKAALGDVLEHYPEPPPGVLAAYRSDPPPTTGRR